MVNTSRTLATGTFLRTAVNGRSRPAPSLGVESLKFRQKYCWPIFQQKKLFPSVILTFSTSASFGHWLAKLCWWWHCVLWRDEPASVLLRGENSGFWHRGFIPGHSSWKVAIFMEISHIVMQIHFNGCLSFWRLNIVWWLEANIAEHTCPSIDSFQSWHNTWLHQGVFLFQGQTKSHADMTLFPQRTTFHLSAFFDRTWHFGSWQISLHFLSPGSSVSYNAIFTTKTICSGVKPWSYALKLRLRLNFSLFWGFLLSWSLQAFKLKVKICLRIIRDTPISPSWSTTPYMHMTRVRI